MCLPKEGCSIGLAGYNTNLASEFYVMSVLYRLGLEPHLTLGNKKSVDIAVLRGQGKAITIDVMGVAGKNESLVGRQPAVPRHRHYVVLVRYDGRFESHQDIPRSWVIPHDEFLSLVNSSKTGSAFYVRRKQILEDGGAFDNAWPFLEAGAEE